MQAKDWETVQFNKNKWKHVPPSDQFTDPEKSILRVKEGGYAYHSVPDVGYQYINRYFTDREVCELTEIHLLKPLINSFAVHPNSTFIEMFRIG